MVIQLFDWLHLGTQRVAASVWYVGESAYVELNSVYFAIKLPDIREKKLLKQLEGDDRANCILSVPFHITNMSNSIDMAR